MAWQVIFLPEVNRDFKSIGAANAKRAIKAIKDKLENGEPDKIGFPLRKLLAGYRKLRVGDIRIVYKVNNEKIEVLIVAVGPRRNDAVYKSAEKRAE